MKRLFSQSENDQKNRSKQVIRDSIHDSRTSLATINMGIRMTKESLPELKALIERFNKNESAENTYQLEQLMTLEKMLNNALSESSKISHCFRQIELSNE